MKALRFPHLILGIIITGLLVALLPHSERLHAFDELPGPAQLDKPRTNAPANLEAITAATHEIPLDAGWNMISSYLVPGDPQLDILLAGLGSHLVLMKNGRGDVYWPDYDINQIAEWQETGI